MTIVKMAVSVRVRGALLATGLIFLVSSVLHAGQPPQIDWIRQLGTSSNDFSRSVAIDGNGSAWISGYTLGDLDGPGPGTPASNYDAFLTKYDSEGTLEWTRQLGIATGTYSYSVAVDDTGNAWISGYTLGDLDGPGAGSHVGNRDVFLAKYDSNGSLEWTRQLGSSGHDESTSVAVDRAGNAWISGYTEGDLDGAGPGTHAGNFDAFLTKYKPDGTLEWTRQLGSTSRDGSSSVAIDGTGNAWVSGNTFGDLDGTGPGTYAGVGDAFLAKYDIDGSLEWTRQLGTASSDESYSVAVDVSGNAWISGWTRGDLDGTNAGSFDALLTKYDSEGTLEWTKQLGTTGGDISYSVAVDGDGSAWISGYTLGDLDGSGPGMPAGSRDAFLVKFFSVPEPSSVALALLGLVAILGMRKRRIAWHCANQ